LLVAGDRKSSDRDIELYVSAFRQEEQRSLGRQVCCEEITLTARGYFVAELPSAAIPLLVPDLPVFLWWRDVLRLEDKVFQTLVRAADRLVIDSADFQNPLSDLPAVVQFLAEEHGEIAVSDINWARLTSWRALLANFYDVQEYLTQLDEIEQVLIDYVSQDSSAGGFAAQPLLISGWLASRLGWDLVRKTPEHERPGLSVEFVKNNRSIKLQLRPVERPAMKPGRLAHIELNTQSGQSATFLVRRTDDGLHLETQAAIGEHSFPGSMLPVRNRSTARLLSREMEILVNDKIYEEAIEIAARMAALGW
jgi:glucose-6-phosphate dehydrogenase assembly protein OpcA